MWTRTKKQGADWALQLTTEEQSSQSRNNEFNASKTQYCTLSNKRCPSEHSVVMNNQALPRSHSFRLLVVVVATAAGISFRATKVLLTIQPSHAIRSPDKT
nr:unnamed protein product [Callosobruchus chinensis]